MYADARKIHLIETIIRMKDERLLEQIEALAESSSSPSKPLRPPSTFVAMLTEQEADEMMRAINESCEVIYPSDWKDDAYTF